MPNPGRMRSMFIIFSNGSIIPPGFKFTELHAFTLAARSYALLWACICHPQILFRENKFMIKVLSLPIHTNKAVHKATVSITDTYL